VSSAFAAFLDASVRTATPLAFAALGETVAERAGVINLGIEGALIGGRLAHSSARRISVLSVG